MSYWEKWGFKRRRTCWTISMMLLIWLSQSSQSTGTHIQPRQTPRQAPGMKKQIEAYSTLNNTQHCPWLTHQQSSVSSGWPISNVFPGTPCPAIWSLQNTGEAWVQDSQELQRWLWPSFTSQSAQLTVSGASVNTKLFSQTRERHSLNSTQRGWQSCISMVMSLIGGKLKWRKLAHKD